MPGVNGFAGRTPAWVLACALAGGTAAAVAAAVALADDAGEAAVGTGPRAASAARMAAVGSGARAAAAAVAALSRPAPPAASSAEATDAAVDRPPHDCRVAGFAHAVRCGTLRRPLDPAVPEGATIGVHYVVVPALSRQKLPDPVFFLAGGPGQSAIDVAPQVMPIFARLNNRRDLVFVDQRGTGRSEPLDCPDDAADALGAALDAQVAALRRCRAELVRRPALRRPGALGHFTTPLAMQDLDAVRRALGAERIDLVGVSYGTRAALDYLRQFPGRVRRAVLDSVAPPDIVLPASFSTDGQAALQAVFEACEREPACRRAYPALRADWAALLGRLPWTVDTRDPLTGRPERTTLTRDRVLGAVRGALYGPAVAAALPAAITEAAAGRGDGLIGLAALFGSRRGLRLAAGLHFSVVCAEDVPLLDRPRDGAALNLPGVDFGAASATLYRRVCAEWPRGTLPATFYDVPPTSVRTLLLAGGLDPATPPRHARRVAQALGPAAQLVVVPNAGHSLLPLGCAPDLLFRFVDADDAVAAAPLDAACLQRIPRPLAFVPPQREPAAASAPFAPPASR